METTKIAVFRGTEIRRRWDDSRHSWFFSVVDVIAALTDSENPSVYWRVLKKRLKDEGADQTVTKCNAFKMPAADGKMRLTDMADIETMFRIIQSIPSRKAEPFKRWLAKVEPENELSQNKTISRPRRTRNSWNEANEQELIGHRRRPELAEALSRVEGTAEGGHRGLREIVNSQ